MYATLLRMYQQAKLTVAQLEAAVVKRWITRAQCDFILTLPVPHFVYTRTDLNLDVDASTSVIETGAIANYAWTFGDDVTVEGVTASHLFTESGTFVVTLTVTAENSETGVLAQSIEVTAPLPLP